MLLWLGFAVLSAAVLAVVLRPLCLAAPANPGADATAVYRDQIVEIDSEVERGLLAPEEADAARAEIGRRLLAADASRNPTAASASSPAASNGFVTGLGLLVPVLTVAIYVAVGSPGYVDQPLSGRAKAAPEIAEFERLIAAVESRLQTAPEDGQGWDVIAPVYLRRGDYGKAADAYGHAIRLLGETTRRLAGFAEATVLANEGTVTEPARAAYAKLGRLEPARLEPRFWLAYADEQAGRFDEAAAAYRALLVEPEADTNSKELFRERLQAVEGKRTAGGSPPQAQRGPTTADVAAADKLGAEERQQMIDTMVQGLADRLAKEPRDLPGWQRLIRAYAVQGRRDAAAEALKTARSTFANETDALSSLSSLARSLGLET